MQALQLNDLLESAGLHLPATRLLRHQQALQGGLTPFYLWSDYPKDFHFYQSTQDENKRSILKDAQHWVSFVATPTGSTLFVGVYAASFRGVLDYDVDFASDRTQKLAGSCDEYETLVTGILSNYIGRLTIEWGLGARSWIQYPQRQPKTIIGLTERKFSEAYPGHLRFRRKLSEINGLPPEWRSMLSATRGVYLLTCPKTKEQYVGSACGAGGFYARWQQHLATGGDAIRLQSREASDYQVSILEVAGSAMNPDDIIAAEVLWKNKLQSREMGLNGN